MVISELGQWPAFEANIAAYCCGSGRNILEDMLCVWTARTYAHIGTQVFWPYSWPHLFKINVASGDLWVQKQWGIFETNMYCLSGSQGYIENFLGL